MANVVDSEIRTVFSSLTLRLNTDEIEVLKDILNCVGGCPQDSRRKHTNSIREAMRRAGVPVEPTGEIVRDRCGSISFKSALDIAVEDRKKEESRSKSKTYKGMTRFEHDDEVPF